ncbi:unnamed protein product [Allacma fusca]|uniref:Uncharacterized protein n=1 Tax=Allacma fusca TaxID=39272 RepID=A0A8J2PU74_9HEXA|nr:unnamed protein product [Allacma fusca]
MNMWLLPILGNYGIGMSDGTIKNFSRNYEIGINTISFGVPTKYCKLNPALAEDEIEGWDGSHYFCHERLLKQWNRPLSCSQKNPSYVAQSLNNMGYGGNLWNQFSIWLLMLRHSRYTNFSGYL